MIDRSIVDFGLVFHAGLSVWELVSRLSQKNGKNHKHASVSSTVSAWTGRDVTGKLLSDLLLLVLVVDEHDRVSAVDPISFQYLSKRSILERVEVSK